MQTFEKCKLQFLLRLVLSPATSSREWGPYSRNYQVHTEITMWAAPVIRLARCSGTVCDCSHGATNDSHGRTAVAQQKRRQAPCPTLVSALSALPVLARSPNGRGPPRIPPARHHAFLHSLACLQPPHLQTESPKTHPQKGWSKRRSRWSTSRLW